MAFYFAFNNVENRVSQRKALKLLHHCRRNKVTSVMKRRMKIVALFQAKVKSKRRKSQNNQFLSKRKKKNDLQLTETISACNSASMNDTSTKELICKTCEKKANALESMNVKCFKCKCR